MGKENGTGIKDKCTVPVLQTVLGHGTREARRRAGIPVCRRNEKRIRNNIDTVSE